MEKQLELSINQCSIGTVREPVPNRFSAFRFFSGTGSLGSAFFENRFFFSDFFLEPNRENRENRFANRFDSTFAIPKHGYSGSPHSPPRDQLILFHADPTRDRLC